MRIEILGYRLKLLILRVSTTLDNSFNFIHVLIEEFAVVASEEQSSSEAVAERS